MTRPTQFKQLPAVPKGLSADQRQFFDAVKQTVETGEGHRGDPLDRKLTERDLIEIGLANAKRGTGGRRGGGGAGATLEPNVTLPNLTVPPRVANFSADGAATRVILSWAAPQYSNHSHVQIRRANVKDFGKAVDIGTPTGRISVDVTGGGFSGYYWAANVSTSDVRGPWSGPVAAKTPADAEYMLEQLTGKVMKTQLAQDLLGGSTPQGNGWGVSVLGTVDGSPIIGGFGIAEEDGIIDFGVVANRFWVANPGVDYRQEGKVLPFVIDQDGKVYINVAVIKEASIQALKVEDAFLDNLTVEKGTLNHALIDVGDIFNLNIGNIIQSEDYIAGTQGWRATKGGAMELNEGLVVNATAVIDKAQIKEAAVDTLKLAGQAVTFPVSTSTNGSSALSDSWGTYQTVTLNVTGAPTIVTVSCVHYMIDNDYDASGVFADCLGRIVRDGFTVVEITDLAKLEHYFFQHSHSGADGGITGPATTETVIAHGFGGFSFQIQDDPPQGQVTYELQLRSDIPRHTVRNRVISVIETKR